MSTTFTFTGYKSELTELYFPPFELDPTKVYVIGLIDFQTFNSIPNIEENKNRFYIGDHTVTIPVGQYEITDLEEFIMKTVHIKQNPNHSDFEYESSDNENESETRPKKDYFSLLGNPNTLKCTIESSLPVDFRPKDSIRELLGFEAELLEADYPHESTNLVNISKINVFQIDCSIVTGRKLAHTLHEFSPQVSPGYKIVEVPSSIIYLPINTHTIDNITIRIVNQDGQLVNFRGELITLRVHLKSL